MGGRGGGGGGKVTNANAGGGVPASARKVVQSLKEIVNCSELEIYTMLVECDMDPDETVNRLLSQDTFHEVKSKRDKKKETKDPADSWTRSSNISNRGGRSGNDSYNNTRGVPGGNKYNSNETGNANRRENGTRNHWATTTTASSGLLGRQPPPSNSDFASVEVKKQPTGLIPSDVAVASSSSSLPSNPPVYQSAWVNANPGQRTMADIVKMGKQKQHVAAAHRSSETTTQESKTAPLKDEWPSIEKQDVVLKPSFDETTTHLNDYEETKPDPIGSLPPDAAPVSVSSRNLLDDDFRDSSLREDENNNNDLERHTYENNDAEDVSVSVSVAAATGFEQLTIENEEEEEDEDYEEEAKEEKPAVIIPDHLQVHTSECSHLMFGSFGAPAIRSGQEEETHEEEAEEDDSTFRHETEYYGEEEEEEQLRNVATDEQTTSYQIDTTARNYHASSESETEPAPTQQHEQPPLQEDHHPQYKFSSSSPPDYGFENNQQQTNPQLQNLDTFPNVMQHTLLQSGIQDPRGGETDLHHYSPFPTKYNNTTTPSPSSLTNPAAISMAEALRAASISPQTANQQQQAAAAALAQHLALNPYSHHQPGMPPLGHYGNLISYPFMPQSYNPYMPSAFQQAAAFPNNHQSLAAAAMLPQYKTQGTVAAASPSAPPPPLPSGGYNSFGGLNPTSVANSYEDVLNSQFKDSNHLASQLQQQQNENWHQGQQQQQQPNSRVVPGSGYYSFPGQHQNQQPPGFRQAQQQQQQQQQYGGHSGYVSPYHSQAAAMSLDHLHHQHQQQQIARDASKQSQQQQLWPNNNY